MAKITLILGGARSGKSALACQLAAQSELAVTYIATATARDAEMATRKGATRWPLINALRSGAHSVVEAGYEYGMGPEDLARTVEVDAFCS